MSDTPGHEDRPAPDAPEVEAKAGTDDRRSAPRTPLRQPIGFVPVLEGGRFGRGIPATTADVSSGGLKLRSPEALEVGTAAVVQMVHEHGRLALFGVRVCHCRATEDGSGDFVIGVAFGPLPAGVSADRFRDEQGRLMLLDPRLKPTAQ